MTKSVEPNMCVFVCVFVLTSMSYGYGAHPTDW